MHAKKFLAAFLALTMTAVPQTTVSVFAENEKVQENNDGTSEDETDEKNTEETDGSVCRIADVRITPPGVPGRQLPPGSFSMGGRGNGAYGAQL